MKWRVTYIIPNTPQGEKNKAKTATVIDSEQDRDWIRFRCADGSLLHVPERWVSEIEEIDE